MGQQYGDDDRIRRMSGAFATSNIPEEDVTTANGRASTTVEQITGKRPWQVSDPEYDMIQLAVEYFASAELMSRFKDKQPQIDMNIKLANELLQRILDMRTADSSSLGYSNVFVSEYKTRNLNPEKDIFRSTKYAKVGDTQIFDV